MADSSLQGALSGEKVVESAGMMDTGEAAPETDTGSTSAKEEGAHEASATSSLAFAGGGAVLSGKALAVQEGMLSAAVPGMVYKVHVKRGDRVKKGQVLVELDKRGFQIGVKQAKAGLDGAKAQQEQLENETARVKKLLSSGAAPTATYDQMISQGKGAEANVHMAEAGLANAKKALGDAVLRAPYDGVIDDLYKQQGEYAPAMPPTPLVKIVDTSSMEVQVFVSEGWASRISLGQRAKVRIDSADLTDEGEVIFVSDVISPGTRSFEVRIKLGNPDGKIKAGAYAQVSFSDSSSNTAN